MKPQRKDESARKLRGRDVANSSLTSPDQDHGETTHPPVNRDTARDPGAGGVGERLKVTQAEAGRGKKPIPKKLQIKRETIGIGEERYDDKVAQGELEQSDELGVHARSGGSDR